MGLRTDGPISNRAGTGPAALTKQWAAKAWANLNGTGTIALRDSRNVSSAVDNGTGDYSFNFASAMSNASYVKIGNSSVPASTAGTFGVSINGAAPTPTTLRLASTNNSLAIADVLYADVQTHGDLA